MKRISKQQQSEIDQQIISLKDAAEELEAAIDEYNTALSALKVPVQEAFQAYNNKIANLKSIYDGLASEARGYYDERSEKWQESDAGQAYNEWCDQLENLDAIEEIDIEFPDEIDRPDFPDYEDDSWLPPSEP